MSKKQKHRSFALVAALGWCLSATSLLAAHVAPDQDREEYQRGYDAEYIFAATYGLTEMNVPPVLKVPLVPVTLVMDVALLPFEVVAGCF